MKKIGIYQIKNVINGKSYIGKSIDVPSRKWHHKNALLNNRHKNTHLQAAFNKYGEDAFRFKILKEFDSVTPEELTEWEIHFIKEYNTIDPGIGYNQVLRNEDSKTIQEAIAKRRKTQTSSAMNYKLRKYFSVESENKQIIFDRLDTYLLNGHSFSVKVGRASLKITVSKHAQEVERFYLCKDTLKYLTKPDLITTFAILEIEAGTSNIIGRWGSPNEVVKQYDLKYASLSTVLHANRDKQTAFYSLKDKFFIREQDYNPAYIYETQWQINAKAPKEVKENKAPRAIEELDSNGTVIKIFARRSDVVNEYSLRAKSLDRVLCGERSKIANRYFRYAQV